MDKKKFVAAQMVMLDIPYELLEWTSEVVYPYLTGEFTEKEVDSEDGHEQSTLLLTMFHRGSYGEMEKIREKIKRYFRDLRSTTDSGTIVMEYENAFYIPSGETDLKKMQINIDIKEWKGDI